MIRKTIMLFLAGVLLAGCSYVPKVLGSKPMRFECTNLNGYIRDYNHRGFLELQQYAYAPDDPRRPGAQGKMTDEIVDSITLDKARHPSRPMRMLVLSGGGQWGAFGAGFLNALPKEQQQFDIVTGISTGAIQSLFVGAGDFVLMNQLYGLQGIGNPAFNNKLYFLSRGSEHNISPLRKMLNEQLIPREEPGLLHKIATRSGNPRIIVGLVEGFSTRLKVVDLTAYIRENYKTSDETGATESNARLADCVTGVVLGSSSIPLRLTPVQIEDGASHPEGFTYRTFMDGGVRLSVIDQFIMDSAELSYAASLCSEVREGPCTQAKLLEVGQKGLLANVVLPQVFIVRNGPTIVPRGELDREIDRDPDGYTTALRGYSVLVNQNELASITEMQSRNPFADIHYVSADGYNWLTKIDDADPSSRKPCSERNEKNYFDGEFMRCLRSYGAWRQAQTGWQHLSTDDEKSLDGILPTPPRLPSADTIKRVDAILRRQPDPDDAATDRK